MGSRPYRPSNRGSGVPFPSIAKVESYSSAFADYFGDSERVGSFGSPFVRDLLWKVELIFGKLFRTQHGPIPDFGFKF